MSSNGFKIGDRVEFAIDDLGALLVTQEHGARFEAATFSRGQFGVITAELPRDREGEQWWSVQPEENHDVYVPVHASMIEPAA